MFRKKPSFFERITGSVRIDDTNDFDIDEEEYDDEPRPQKGGLRARMESSKIRVVSEDEFEETPLPTHHFTPEIPTPDGELTVDVIETQDNIILKTMVAGVDPDHVDIDVSRDAVTIKGERKESHRFSDDEYHHQELYWGTFSRTIMLPAEIEVEEAEARAEHGLLTITLPKIDKYRKTKLRVSKK